MTFAYRKRRRRWWEFFSLPHRNSAVHAFIRKAILFADGRLVARYSYDDHADILAAFPEDAFSEAEILAAEFGYLTSEGKFFSTHTGYLVDF